MSAPGSRVERIIPACIFDISAVIEKQRDYLIVALRGCPAKQHILVVRKYGCALR